MLAQFICDAKSQGRLKAPIYPPSYRSAITSAAAEIVGAMRLRISEDVAAMAVHCANESHEKFLAALRMARLPHPVTWIEIQQSDLENAYALVRGTAVEPCRQNAALGFLCKETNEGIVVRQIHRRGANGPDDGVDKIDVSFVRHNLGIGPWWDTSYRRRESTEITPEELEQVRKRDVPVRCEITANAIATEYEYAHRVSIMQTQSEKSMYRDNLMLWGRADADDTVENHSRVHSANIKDIVLPVLILLCCKNATQQRAVQYDAKVHKDRARAGKAPLLACNEVISHLVPKSARAAGGTRESRAAMVMGHYKVRATGIFWWSPHARRGYGTASMNKLLKH